MIDLRHVRAVLAIARHEHFTRAAAALGLAQPALSQQIAQLEDDLGVRLFERSRRGARLTEAGRAFRARAERARPPAPPGVSSMVVSEEELVLAVPRRHRLAGTRTVAFADLAAEPFVLYKEGSMLRELTLAAAAAAGFTVRSTLEASGNDT